MDSDTLGRHLPFFIWLACVLLLAWFVERQHYPPNTGLAIEIFGSIVLAFGLMRNYTGPRFMSVPLPRLAAVVVSLSLALAALFLFIVLVIRIRQ